jgi:hypothetical protein
MILRRDKEVSVISSGGRNVAYQRPFNHDHPRVLLNVPTEMNLKISLSVSH